VNAHPNAKTPLTQAPSARGARFTSPLAHPKCPRCAYDLSGPIADWTTECPIDGLCPECGQHFRYGDVFFPERLDSPRFVEHARAPVESGLLRRALTVFGAAWSTWVWAIAPTVFFRRVRVQHRVVASRMLLWLIVLVLPLHVVASALSMFRVQWIGLARLSAQRPEWMALLSCWTYPIFSVEPPSATSILPFSFNFDMLGGPVWILMALGMHLAYAFTVIALPWTRRAAQVHLGHVLRAGIYGLWWCVLLAIFRLVRNAWTAVELLSMPRANTQFSAPPGTINALVFRRNLGLTARPYFLDDLDESAMTVVALAIVAVWWLCVFRIGWKVDRAGVLFTLLTIIGALVAACIAVMR
jgi:hypothetical protein